MNSAPSLFLSLETPLALDRRVHPDCVVSVIVPARNEEASISATLAALMNQVDLLGQPLNQTSYEVLLLVNNCTDQTARLAREFALHHLHFNLHLIEAFLEAEIAHVGTARKLLMDLACTRLEENRVIHPGALAILSTDADSAVAPDWVAQNLAEIERGAEVVGGVINLWESDLAALDDGTRLAVDRDRELNTLIAQLESVLDPDPADPWPRHLNHFGASLACTPEAYRRCGGMPPVSPLEDLAFVDEMRKVSARIRHSPAVNIYTSARLDGRAEVGLSGQLRHWQREATDATPHLVDSCAWLRHRFSRLAALRALNDENRGGDIGWVPQVWRERVEELRQARLPTPRFLELVDCDRLIESCFGDTERRAEITAVIKGLRYLLDGLKASSEQFAGVPVDELVKVRR